MEKRFIISIIAIVTILVVVFLSQQSYFETLGKNLISGAADRVNGYVSAGTNWISSDVYPKITGEVEKRGEMIQNEINQQKQDITESVGKKIQNYFSGVANSILGKENNNCLTPAPAQTTAN